MNSEYSSDDPDHNAAYSLLNGEESYRDDAHTLSVRYSQQNTTMRHMTQIGGDLAIKDKKFKKPVKLNFEDTKRMIVGGLSQEISNTDGPGGRTIYRSGTTSKMQFEI